MDRENIIEDRVRLYSLVMYNISGIQAGIQAKHSGIELAMAHAGDDVEDTVFLEWAKFHKTVILLNGGTSNSGKESYYGLEICICISGNRPGGGFCPSSRM